jgi:putative flippase GtrA
VKKISISELIHRVNSAFNRTKRDGLIVSVDYYQDKYFGKHADKLRFATVGSINTLLDFGILISLVAIGLNPLLGNIVSTSVAFIFSFYANKNYTFKSQTGNLGRQFLLFVVVTLFGLWGLQSIALLLTTQVLSTILTNESTIVILGKIIASLISLTWNYIMYSRVVFKK